MHRLNNLKLYIKRILENNVPRQITDLELDYIFDNMQLETLNEIVLIRDTSKYDEGVQKNWDRYLKPSFTQMIDRASRPS